MNQGKHTTTSERAEPRSLHPDCMQVRVVMGHLMWSQSGTVRLGTALSSQGRLPSSSMLSARQQTPMVMREVERVEAPALAPLHISGHPCLESRTLARTLHMWAPSTYHLPQPPSKGVCQVTGSSQCP
jgi:hypothetical protein